MYLPVSRCSSPRRAMISVPEGRVREPAAADALAPALEQRRAGSRSDRSGTAGRARCPSSPSARWCCPCPASARPAARARRADRRWRARPDRGQPAEPQRLQDRQVQPSRGLGDVPQRVAAAVAVGRRVGQLADADAVQHHEEDPHVDRPFAAATACARCRKYSSAGGSTRRARRPASSASPGGPPAGRGASRACRSCT